MLSYIRPEDHVWDVPVVLFCVWTAVLAIASLIVVSCLRNETKKFNKRLRYSEGKEDIVGDIVKLDSIMAKYVKQILGKGVLKSLVDSIENDKEGSQIESLRAEAKQWFDTKVEELSKKKMSEKLVKRTILSSIRAGLTKNPLDLRGSRRALEAAKLFREFEEKKESMTLLNTNPFKDTSPTASSPSVPAVPCPSIAWQWVPLKVLKVLSVLESHPSTIPFLFVFFSFLVWLYDCITDMVIIKIFWNFQLPILYPVNESFTEESVTYLTYQTLTIDLYAPLLLLILLFSMVFTLLSCSCSRLSDRYDIATMYSSGESEVSGQDVQDPTTILARYDFQLNQAVTASLPQFCLQFAAYMVILYMLETLKGLSVDQTTIDMVQEKIDTFTFRSLWFSGLGSALSLVVAQYTALKIQHEHDLTFGQRLVYFFSCVFNTISMMTSCVVFVTMIIVPFSTYIGQFHLMIIVIMFTAILILGTIICIILAVFGMDSTTILTDRVVTKFQTNNLLTSFLRFSQVGNGHWASILGAIILVGKLFSLMTINLFLPPSQLLIHPFTKFYVTSSRSPALHQVMAKHLVYYNIIFITSSILLCVNINEYGFNYNITPATENLFIYANITGVPFIFLSYFALYKFYTSCDIWASNGVHLVFHQDLPTIIDSPENGFDMRDNTEEEHVNSTDAFDEKIAFTDGPTDKSKTELNEEHNESTEADRNHLNKKLRMTNITKQTAKLKKRVKKSCCPYITDVALVEVEGQWVNVSD